MTIPPLPAQNSGDWYGWAQGVDGAARAVFAAPAPSGGDDTAALQALVNLATTTNGKLILQPGVYKANLATPSGYIQPLIEGTGRHQTTIQAVSNTAPAFQFNGGSGSLAGGGLRSLALQCAPQGGGQALVYAGCGGVDSKDVYIAGNNGQYFAEGVTFWNNAMQNFTEFDTFEGCIDGAVQPVRYRVDNGVESFHGSGITGNTIINPVSTSSNPIVQVDSPALPYNAPLSFTAFFNNASQYLINHANTTPGRHASFYGNIRLEGNGGQAANFALVRAATALVYYMGTVSWLSPQTAVLGVMYLVDKVTYQDSAIIAQKRPTTFRAIGKSTASILGVNFLYGGETGLVSVHIAGGNYDKAWVFLVMQSPYNDTGFVQQLAQPSNIDNAALGDPTFTWSGAGLNVANSKFTSAQAIYARFTPLGSAMQSSDLAQSSS